MQGLTDMAINDALLLTNGIKKRRKACIVLYGTESMFASTFTVLAPLLGDIRSAGKELMVNMKEGLGGPTV